MFVSEDYRKGLESSVGHPVHVGDTIPMAFYWSFAENSLPAGSVVKPIGVEHLRVAGFGRFSDEVLPDALFPEQRLVVSADVARKYACTTDLRADMTLDEATDAEFPQDCARSYTYYALRLKGGRQTKVAVRREFEKVARRLSKDVPQAVKDIGAGYPYISQDRAEVEDAVRQVTRPTVTALAVFGIVSGLAMLVVAALAIARILRRNDAAQRTLRALGATRGQRAVIGAGPPLIAALVGIIAAVPIALAASVVGPAGSVRLVDPSPGVALPPVVVVPTVALVGIVLVLIAAALGWSAAMRASTVSDRPERRSWFTSALARRSSPAATEGIRAALTRRRSDGGAAVLAGCVVALAAVVAAVVFATNLTALVSEPTRYGWPWSVAFITNGGYGDTDPAQVAAALDGNRAVKDYALFDTDTETQLAGHPVPTIYGFPGAERTIVPLSEGRQARRPGDAILGSKTAADLGVAVGDRVRVTGPYPGFHSAKVVGIGVMPHLGPLLAGRAGLGTGAFVLSGADASDPALQYPATFTGIQLKSGTDVNAFVAGLDPAPQHWFASPGSTVRSFLSAVRPPEIVNADDMRAAPLLLGGLLAVGLMIGLALSIGVSVRDRRRELAILRSLGFSRRDLRATVGWQAMATIAVGLAVGIPMGIIAGRLAWRAFADQLGVVAHADIPVGWLAVVGLAAILLGLIAAAPPARAAANIAPSDVLSDVT